MLSYLSGQSSNNNAPPLKFPSNTGKICTVEELEKNLIKNSQQQIAQAQQIPTETKPLDGHIIHQQNHLPPNQISSQHAQGQPRPLLPMLPHMVHPYHPMLQVSFFFL